MKNRSFRRSFYITVLIFSLVTVERVLAQDYSLETPFPQLAELVAQNKLSVGELTDILVDGVTDLGDLPPDFAPRPVNSEDFQALLGTAILKKTQELLATQSSAKTIGLKKLSDALLSESDKSRKNVDQLISLAERIEHLDAVEDAVALVNLRSEYLSSSERALLEERIVRLLKRLAKKSEEAKHPDQGLKLLSQVESQWQDEETFTLGKQLLVQYKQKYSHGSEEWIFNEPKQAQFLDSLLEKDTELHALVADLFSNHTINLIKADDVSEAERSFDRVLKERPDPSTLNDELRMRIASVAKSPATQAFAKGRIMDLEFSGRLGFLARAKLLLGGFYGSLFPLALFGCFALVVFFAVLSRMKPDLVVSVPKVSAPIPKLPQRKKKPISGYKRPVEEADEYSRLLALFELDDRAEEDDIKRAYRQKMKDLHPDASAQAENTDAFIDLKHAYERILEIQRSRFNRT